MMSQSSRPVVQTCVARLSLGLIFPMTVLGFAAVSVEYFDTVFTTATRWGLLAALAAFLLHRGKLFLALRIAPAPLILAWLIWITSTTLWSDVPMLSAMKSAATIAAVFAMTSGGIYWARYVRPGMALAYLAPVAAISLFAGVAGFGAFDQSSGGLYVLRGLCPNANTLGNLLAESLPYPIFAAYRAYAREPKHAIPWIGWGIACLILTLFLVLTGSRSAALCAICIISGFAVAVSRIRTLSVAGLVVFAVVAAGIAMPGSLGAELRPVAQFFTKGHPGLLYSRERVWRTSLEHAVKGGSLGLGLGVSANGGNFKGGLTTAEYGREKGNSQLAIVEETGLIGLTIYLALLSSLFFCLLRGARLTDSREARLQLLLLTGLLAGLTTESVFEAWWTSPGSFESIAFWAAAGVAFGIRYQPRVMDIRERPLRADCQSV